MSAGTGTPPKEEGMKALITLGEEACKVSADAAELAKRALGKADANDLSMKTAHEKMEEASRAIKDLTTRLDQAERKIVYPDFDPMRLKYNRSQRGFEQLMRSNPKSDQRFAPLVEELQRASTIAAVFKMFHEGVEGRKFEWGELKQLEDSQRSVERPIHRFEELCNEFGGMIGVKEKRALDTLTTGEGLEWTPTMWGTMLMSKLLVALRAAGLIESVEMPSQAWYWPYVTRYPTAQRVTETTTMTSNAWDTSGVSEGYGEGKPTGSILFTARKARIVQFMSYEYSVDTIAAAINDLVGAIATGMALARETGMINGDRSSTHLDADIVGIGSSGTAPETVVDGLRNYYLAQGAGSYVDLTATPSTIDLINGSRKMSKEYLADISNQYWLTSVLGACHLYANEDIRTLDKLGPNAVIISGQIGNLLGRPIVLCGTMRDNLADTGVNVSGGANDFTSILLAHLGRWKWGTRPSAPMDAERLPLTDQRAMVVHDRYDLQFVGAQTDVSVVGFHGIPQTVTKPV